MTKKEILKEIQNISDDFSLEKLNIDKLLSDFDNEKSFEKKQAIKEIIEEKLDYIDTLESKYNDFVEQIKK